MPNRTQPQSDQMAMIPGKPTAYRFSAAATIPRESSLQESYRWFVWPLMAILILLPVAIVTGARSLDLPGMLVAYLNVVVISLSMIFFLRRRTFEAMVPVLFLLWYLLSWPISTIYFGLFNPDMWYITTMEQHRSVMEGNVRVQSVDMLFLAGYLPMVLLFLPRGSKLPRFSAQNPATVRMVYVAVGISMVAFAGGLYARVTVNYESVLGYIISGLFNYLLATPVIIGVLLPKISRSVKMLVFGFFGVTSPVYLLYHSRFNLLVPWVMMAFGLLLFSDLPQRKKTVWAIIAMIVFPLGIVLGEVTRGMSKGPLQSLEERKEVLSHWQEFLGRDSAINQTMSRFFSTGGHSLITMTPEQVEYLEFDPVRYFTELFVTGVIPGRFYGDYFYSSTYHLNGYGLRVGTTTSVELSLPGSLWMLGGWVPVAVGGIYIGLLHAGLMHWIRSGTRKSPYQGLFYLTMVTAVVMWSFNWDAISLTRALVRAMIAAVLIWHLFVLPILGRTAMTPRFSRRAPPPLAPARA